MRAIAELNELFDRAEVGSDTARIFLIGFGVVLLVLLIQIVLSYAAIPNKDRSRLITWHIILIGASFIMATWMLCLHTVHNANQILTWWFWGKTICFSLGIVGLGFMMLHLRYERKAIGNIRSPFKRCHQCGSHYVDNFCCRCGADQRKEKTL